MNPLNLIIITPVFNDWNSLKTMIYEIDESLSNEEIILYLLIVNDGSTTEINIDNNLINNLKVIKEIELLHLNCNLGHQRAIAVGLADMAARKTFDAVIVMDSDGEDRPADLLALINEYRKNPEQIVVARRDKRSEGIGFRIGYVIYKLLFRLLTGQYISFGNFCLIPSVFLKRLVYHDSLWNHLAASILRSRFPISKISSVRGTRYSGKSAMNLNSLILLGLGAIAVYIDIVLLRTLIVSLLLGIMTIMGIGIVTVIRFFTDLAIPGWASDVVGSLSVILIQFLVISIFVLFIILSNRSQRTFIPAKHYSDYILKLEVIFRQ